MTDTQRNTVSSVKLVGVDDKPNFNLHLSIICISKSASNQLSVLIRLKIN